MQHRFLLQQPFCLCFRQIAPTNPAKPAPINAMELGSGTEIGLWPRGRGIAAGEIIFSPLFTLNRTTMVREEPSDMVPAARPLNV